jgi:hypothetical protein
MMLSTEDTDRFYRFFRSVLAFTNRQLKITGAGDTIEAVRRLLMAEALKVRNALYDKPELLDRYLEQNPDQFTDEDVKIIRSWRQRISGDFFIVRHLKAYTIFMSKKPFRLFGVLGLRDPIEDVLGGRPLPVLVEAVLLPFEGRIIYDGLMSLHSISFGSGIRKQMQETYISLKETEGIIERLSSLEEGTGVRTSLARKTPPKPPVDWRPAIGRITEETGKIRANTKLQGAALGLLRGTIDLFRLTLEETGAEDEAARKLPVLRAQMTRLQNLLRSSEWE